MECNPTSFKRRSGWRERAFTLPELLVSMGISGIVFAAIASLSLYTGRSFAMMANYVDLDNASRNALDIMTRDVRNVLYLSTYQTNMLVFQDNDGLPLTYTYDPQAHTLTRIKGTDNKLLLEQCDMLVFSMYQRNPDIGNPYPVIATNADYCKAIGVTWICSRKMFGAKVNTESVQTAMVVIRNEQR